MPYGPKPFKPGISGNPGGRPKIAAELVALARENMTEALGVILAVMRNKKAGPALRMKAAELVIERAVGRVPQGEANKDPAELLSNEELLAAIAQQLKAEVPPPPVSPVVVAATDQPTP